MTRGCGNNTSATNLWQVAWMVIKKDPRVSSKQKKQKQKKTNEKQNIAKKKKKILESNNNDNNNIEDNQTWNHNGN